jgi:DNA-binding response OmpR family regulator
MSEGPKIVIADDNLEVCELLVEIFKDMGYDVDTVHNGYELISYLETNNPGVIILDLMMPEKSGISILSSLKEIAPFSRIIIYTGHHEFEKSIYARTADKFVLKGAKIKSLIDAVEEFRVKS